MQSLPYSEFKQLLYMTHRDTRVTRVLRKRVKSGIYRNPHSGVRVEKSFPSVLFVSMTNLLSLLHYYSALIVPYSATPRFHERKYPEKALRRFLSIELLVISIVITTQDRKTTENAEQ